MKNSKKNEYLYFEQDGASCHTSKKIKLLLENLFGDKLIQNAPHSPDIAYPIETLWAELKKRVKSRYPKNPEELKIITIEEWNKIPIDYVKKLFINFRKRCEKIIELNGGRSEPEHLREIRKEMEKKEEDDSSEEEKENAYEVEQKQKLKLKLIYSKPELIKKAKKEISLIRKKIKAKKKELKRVKKEYTKARKFSQKKGFETEKAKDTSKYKETKNIELENYKFRVGWSKNYISKNIGEYFNYFKKECDRQEIAKTKASTLDGEIEFRLKSKKEQKEIKMEQEFYSLEYHPKKRV